MILPLRIVFLMAADRGDAGVYAAVFAMTLPIGWTSKKESQDESSNAVAIIYIMCKRFMLLSNCRMNEFGYVSYTLLVPYVYTEDDVSWYRLSI